MEDGAKLISTSEVKSLCTETTGCVDQEDKVTKTSSNELSPDSTTAIENPHTITERMDSYVASKVNGDCSVECSVPSPSSLPPNNNNNNNMSVCKISSEKAASCTEKSDEVIDEIARDDDQKVDVAIVVAEIASKKEVEESKNLSYSSQRKDELPLNEFDELKIGNENPEGSESIQISNMNEVTSTLDEKDVTESNNDMISLKNESNNDMTSLKNESNNDMTSLKNESNNDMASLKHESKCASSKPKKPNSESSFSSKNNDTFKTPLRNDARTSTFKGKTEIAVSENNQRQNEVPVKISSDKTSRNNKRKSEERHTNACEEDANDVEKFPIQYKGFKNRAVIPEKNEKRLNLRWNPFNPACKRNRKSNKYLPSRFPAGDEIDCSALQQSEYAQYLGLQPILKFRCSNCGSSAFQSMVALNTHQIECTKSGKGKLDNCERKLTNPANEPKSTNIKLTRKVFLCSACGTYYEHWNLFLHMREVHRRYICLYCLGMYSIAEKLSEHLIQKHKVTNQNYGNLEEFQKHSYQTYFLLCLTCDKVFSEMDDFYGHVCTVNKKNLDSVDSTSKSEATSSQECNALSAGESCSNTASNKTSTKKTRDSSKKTTVSSKSSQIKKDEFLNGSTVQKSDDTVITDCKEEMKPGDLGGSKSLETANSSSVESISVEQNTNNIPETDTKLSVEQDTKLQESQFKVESLPSDNKSKPARKNKFLQKKVAAKRKKPKEKEEETEVSAAKVKKISEDEELVKEPNNVPSNENTSLTLLKESEITTEHKEEEMSTHVLAENLPQETNAELTPEHKEETEVPDTEKGNTTQEESTDVIKEELTSTSVNMNVVDSKNKLKVGLMKFVGVESDNESDDSQKLSVIVDENANSDTEQKLSSKTGENSSTDSEVPETSSIQPVKADKSSHPDPENVAPDVVLASEDVAVMALTLDDKIENIPIQTVLKECVRTSCMSCNYCRHAVKIAVNGKQLALHILSEHRFMPIKNETLEDVINKLKSSLDTLRTMYFNTETYDSSEPSIHVPYDQDSSFDCFQCNYVTTSHRDLFAHKRKSHTKSLLLCIMCKSNFYSYSELLCHLCPGTYNTEVQFHNVDINFRCCFCRLDTIPSAFRLMVHLRKTHHTCDICLENGVDQQKLSNHMWKHKLNHLCYRCGIAYASKPDITKHLFWKHGHESVLCKKCLQKKWPHVYHFCIPPTSFICDDCNTSFSKAVALKVHKRIHGNDFPYSCTECGKKFVSKKLLQRHEERHNAIKNIGQQQNEDDQEEEQKEEIINVSDIINDNKEMSTVAELSDTKDTEPKDKSHKKHKKDKDKKDKQVVDVYDLPPLNLSSESDSSDEENNVNDTSSQVVENNDDSSITEDVKKENLLTEENKETAHNILHKEDLASNPIEENTDENITSSISHVMKEESNNINSEENKLTEKEQSDIKVEGDEISSSNVQSDEAIVKDAPKSDEKTEQVSGNLENVSSDDLTENKLDDNWQNFYTSNPQNSNLPYPLCAVKSEIAIGIIMGDHDYCHLPPPPEPIADKEEIPSTSRLPDSLINDQLEEINQLSPQKVSELPNTKDVPGTSSPVNSPKKKPKSPKKKNSKGENENNSSSSSESSSESSTTTCSCGPNCSCSSSSSNSSSSSSSDSDSSAGEEGNKQERKRKKRERRSKTKSDHEPELPKDRIPVEPEKTIPLEPVDPPIRESELETDETTTDEEFYDQQPQRIANQLIAEKRNQLMMLATAANVNNGNASPSPMTEPLQPEVAPPPKQKVRTKRKRKITTKGKSNAERSSSNAHSYSHYAKDNDQVSKPVLQYHTNPLPAIESKLPSFVGQSVAMTETPGSGSETEKSRSSKRRRIPNKFYGYSSGDDEEKPTPSPKWRKQENQVIRIQQPAHPPTPRIQLTLPKQIIKKPIKIQKPVIKPQQPSSSDSTDSGSEMENQRSTTVPPVNQETSTSATSQKNEKDVYCYCRCPYDEVSEMIACDDENCEIEWFHFECVGILVPPRGQWFCPGCRKARGLPT